MIPTNILLLIGTKLPKEDVYTYCQLNKTTSNICQSEVFWKKLLHEQYGDFFIVTKPNNRNLFEWYRYLMKINIFDKDSRYILDLAENNGLVELKNYIQSSLLVDSLILNEKYEELEKIPIDRDILFISVDAWTVLISDNHYNIILWLLENGANIHVESDFPLSLASSTEHTEIVKLLLENGANPHAYWDNALRRASYYGRTEIVKLLLEYKANVHANNEQALRWASKGGHTEIVKLLLENKADIHANNDEALRDASMEGHTEIVKLLLKYGANSHALNDEPLKLAQRYGHTDIVKLLKAAMYSLIYSTKVGNMMLLNDINRLMYF